MPRDQGAKIGAGAKRFEDQTKYKDDYESVLHKELANGAKLI